MTAAKAAAAPSTYITGLCASGFHDRCRGTYAGCECTCAHHTAPPEPVAVAVHCFFGCEYVARDEDPQAAHDAMEDHYRLAHWGRIRELIGWVTA